MRTCWGSNSQTQRQKKSVKHFQAGRSSQLASTFPLAAVEIGLFESLGSAEPASNGHVWVKTFIKTCRLQWTKEEMSAFGFFSS